MPHWVHLEEVGCLARPAVVSFRAVPTEQSPGYRFYRRDAFLSERANSQQTGLLWHFGGRPPHHEPLIIDCVADPVALSVQETDHSPAILDVFTVDRDRNLWHRRFSPPPEGSFLLEARGGCLVALFDRVSGRRRLPDFLTRSGWHSLGRCDSNPAGCVRSDGALAVVVRRGEQFFFRRFSLGDSAWEPGWRPIAAPNSTVDPVAAWQSSVVRFYTVSPEGELYMHSLDHPEADGIWLGDGFALLPPAIASERVFALTRDGRVVHRHPDADAEWHLVGDDETRRWSAAPVTLYYQRSHPPRGPDEIGRFLASIRTYVFVRDTAGRLWTASLSLGPSSWTDWEDLNGSETREFSAVQIDAGVALFARGRDDHLWRLEV